MDRFSLNSSSLILRIVAIIVFSATVQWLLRNFIVRANRRRMIREYGCLPIEQLQGRRFLDRPLGIQRMIKWGKEIMNGTWHETMRTEYLQYRRTFPYYTLMEYRKFSTLAKLLIVLWQSCLVNAHEHQVS